MPTADQDAPEAPTSADRARRSATALRVAIGAVFVVTVLAIPQIAAPAPAAAGASCTGWTSHESPPVTIRVLRTASGSVETVQFRRYVAEVMASGEWPTRLSPATLEAGAVATKQYAWYYTMEGHHRPGYVKNGKCYDVRDDVRDQLYRPSRAMPTAKQQRAIDRTWALTLRKNGRFFLTGYRYGTVHRCAGDVNGWKLFETSIETCARKGWSRQRILRRYLSPNLEFVWSKRMGPVLKSPTIQLRAGNTIASGAASVAWKPVSAGYEIRKYQLQRRIGTGQWKDIPLPAARVRQRDAFIKVGFKNRFRVRAVDAKGRIGPWAYSARRTAALRGPVGVSLSETADAEAPKRSAVKTRFRGRSVAYVAPTGPGMGRAKVIVDGTHVATIDLSKKTASKRRLVWTRNFKTAKYRTVKVKAVGSDQGVRFEGFLILK